MSVGDVLLYLTVLFLVGHLALDMRSLFKAVRHTDALWTIATISFLVGHLVMDYVG